MEQTDSPSSNDVSANYHIMIGDHQLLSTADEHQNTLMLHQNFSMGAPQYQHAPHLHVAALPPCTSEPFEGEGCETPLSSYMRCTSSSSLNQRLVANVAPQNNSGAMRPCTSPEGLLDVISVAQKKLQQLQAVVELMVQVGGQTQQQQSLAAGMKSIMSQLFVATAGLRQQREAPWSNQVSGSFSQLNEAMDLRFDGFRSDDTINPMGSFVRSSWDGFFPSSNSCPASMGPELSSSAMELGPIRGVTLSKSSASKGPELTDSAVELVRRRATETSKPSGVMDLQHKEQVLSPPLTDPAKHLAHSRTQNKPVEIENESLVEACDRQVMSRNGNKEMFCLEDHDYASVFRDDDDDGEVENLPPGSYELVEMAATEILAEHTHFCEMCGKGFKRDANLRMHMRGHGDEYKTPAALARPNKCSSNPSMVKLRRYSCPYVGCKRNKKHRKFQPLKTMLCVKNHYRRSHCPKLLTCNKCRTKKFSVVADLKTHEKHCGEDKWHCSCGTTFSRKDKLVGHISLFVGHTPAVPLHEMEGVNGCGEPTFGALLAGEGEGLDLSTFESPPVLPGSGTALNTALMSGSSNELDIPELTIMGKEVLVSDDNGQQRAFHRGEKSFFAENSPRSAMEVMQHCG